MRNYATALDIGCAVPPSVEFRPYQGNHQAFQGLGEKSPLVAWVGADLTFEKETEKLGNGGEEMLKRRMGLLMQSAWAGLLSQYEVIQIQDILAEATGRKLWVAYMNVKRASGSFRLSEKGFECLVTLFNIALTTCEACQDTATIRNCIILSQTFHHLSSSSKEFLQSRLLTHSIWRQENLWDTLVTESIKSEMEIGRRYGGAETEADQVNVVCTQLGSFVHAMNLFGMEQVEVRKLLEKFKWEYHLSASDIAPLLDYSSESPSSPPLVHSHSQSIDSPSDTDEDPPYQRKESRSKSLRFSPF
jgi:hypothetical protein